MSLVPAAPFATTGFTRRSDALIAGALTWVFIAVAAFPLMTIGAWNVFGPQKPGEDC